MFEPIEDIDNRGAHSKAWHTVARPIERVPHLPYSKVLCLVDPFVANCFVEVSLVLGSQSFENKVVRSSPRRSSPHQVNSKDRIEGRVVLSDSGNREIRTVLLRLN